MLSKLRDLNRSHSTRHSYTLVGDFCVTGITTVCMYAVHGVLKVSVSLRFHLLVNQFAINWFWDSPCYEVVDKSEEALSTPIMHRSPSKDSIFITFVHVGVAHNIARASKRSYMTPLYHISNNR